MDFVIALVGLGDDERLAAAHDRVRALAPVLEVRQPEIENATGAARWDEVFRLAEHPWILVLADDERMGPELADEIAALSEDSDHVFAGFRVAIEMTFLGRVVRGGRYRRREELRLVHRERCRPGIAALGIVGSGERTGSLSSVIQWRPFDDLEDGVDRIDRDTGLQVAELARRGARTSAARIVLRPPWVLGRELFLWGGVRDGLRGMILATLVAARELVLHAKLWEQGLPERFRQVPSNPEPP